MHECVYNFTVFGTQTCSILRVCVPKTVHILRVHTVCVTETVSDSEMYPHKSVTIVHQAKNFQIYNLRIFGINTWLNISIDRAHYAQHDCALFRLMTRSGNVFLKYPHNFYKKTWVMMSFLRHRDRL